MDITGNTIFIPGATSGIGLALALRLKAKGNTVIVGGRREHLLDQLKAEHGFDTVRIDTADPTSIAEASASVLATHPDLNVLLAMAGIMNPEDWHAPAGFVESAERIVTTNLLGPIRLIGAFVEHLQAQPKATIVTVSSGLAFVPLASTPSYNATKAGIHLLSESIRIQLSDTSVDVIELAPPAVATDLMDGDFHGMPLDDFADEVVSLFAAQPDATEILVENVKPLRYAEASGSYPQVVAMVNGLGDPQATA